MNKLALKPIVAALALAAGGAFAPSAVAETPADTAAVAAPTEVHFEGRDRNWFNPANWSSGRVPGAKDCVILDGNDDVLIDPAMGGTGSTRAHDIRIIAAAHLETMPGTVLETSGTSTLESSALVLLRSSAWIGGDFKVLPHTEESVHTDDHPGSGGVWLNPTPQNKRIVVLQSNVISMFGLGGRTPASVVKDASGRLRVANGYGHYSTWTAKKTTLAGDLWLNLHYDFHPAAGDRFLIVDTSGKRKGQFTGLPEGALAACSDDGVGLSISYRGGDGNDVELIAAAATPEACRAPTVQPLFQIGSTLSIFDPGVAQTREHILLARQVGVP